MNVIDKYHETMADIHRLSILGGSESLFGKEHIFVSLLRDEHEKDGLTSGMYCFKGLNQYGNVVSWEPFLRATVSFIKHGFRGADLEELRDWWGKNSSIDTACLGAYVSSALGREDIKAILAKADVKYAKALAEEEARIAAIPHLKPDEDALPYKHDECIEDFAGNHSQAGAWADTHVNESGQKIITFGGGWSEYCRDGTLDKFMDGERGCPVEARPAKVEALYKKVDADADWSFSVIIDFLNENKDGLRFSEEFKWDGK